MPRPTMPSSILLEETASILHNSDGSHFSPSAYDTAWLARIPNPDNSGQPLFPQCLQWLKHNQHTDGSWGSFVTADYHFDKVICTLAAVTTLAIWRNQGWPLNDLIEKGTGYLNTHIHLLNKSNNRTVGFELLLPALYQEALDNGIELQSKKAIEEMQELRARKLNKVDKNTIFERPVTLLHSLEGLPPAVINWEKVIRWQDNGGSFLTSPAATAFVYMHTGNQACLDYLKKVLKNNNYVTVGEPLDIFETAWCLKIISKLELKNCFKQEYAHKINLLKKYWNEKKGISWSSAINLPDLDDTAVAYYLLRKEGAALQPEVFNSFFSNDRIFCFPDELDSSPTHLLNFLHAYDGNDPKLMNTAMHQLNALLMDDWTDKWHLSPYYFTSILIDSLFQSPSMNKNEIINFIMKNQREDGGWGIHQSNPEETAWACTTLLLDLKSDMHNNLMTANIFQSLRKGIDYLINYKMSSGVNRFVNLWVEKCLFTPYSIVNILINAVILSSLDLFED